MSMLTAFLAIPFPNLDPVALQIGPVAIKWYGLAYLAGLVLGWIYIRRLITSNRLWANDTPPFSLAKVDDLLLYITAGVVLGGRLGFVLFYEPGYYLANPQDIIAVWKGGMAFHGALVGCIVAIWVFARNNGVNPWSTGDLVTAAVPIGLFFGRVANFVNGELYGRPTTMPWGMVFPEAAINHPAIEPTTRHPSQLYEALLEGLVLFIVLRVMTHHFGALKRPGLVAGTFLAGYALARSTAELFREPHFAHAFNVGPLTAGIAYSIPMLLLGLMVIYWARTRELK
ncbi:Prolipoprotein diacylglyceryl transferase [Hyphomicrobium sulfonivorans]|uniref:Phosphatidylglycerol--prolipoprotein diacylglyceryl transferase n=1 Tax=Hyphomicrobium sulfonivorans TaxID=121290 RepID=A0A109B8K5_HYPSL|nr:prolipoprotein diacylglyceryl transferase [Hyphomicrobium sulfonivorans]KWT64196.1 Prolipoprotein diacylglyceryl transferase [Hyphomicrobium sulfonivorans]